jgi:hypothetical protein
MFQPSAWDFQLALQADRDTPATAPEFFANTLEGSDISVNPEVVTVKTGEGSRCSDGISFIAGAPVGGKLIIVGHDNILPFLTYLSYGSLAKSGVGDPFSWAGTINQSGGVPFFTGFKHVGDLYEIYPCLKVNTFAFETASDGENQLLKVTLDVVGIGLPSYENAWALPAAKEDAGHIFTWSMGASEWKVDGTTVAGISSFALNGNNNLTTVPGELKTGYDLSEGDHESVVTTRLVVEDLERYLQYMYGDSTPTPGAHMDLDTLQTGSFAGKLTRVAASPGPERSFAVAVPDLIYAAGEPPRIQGQRGGPLYHTLGGRAQGTNPKITVTTKNGVAAYDLIGS